MEPASRITQSRLDCQSQGRLSQLAISDVLGPVGLAFFSALLASLVQPCTTYLKGTQTSTDSK